MNYLMLAVIMIFILLVVPYIIGRRSGRSLREVLFGTRGGAQSGGKGTGTPSGAKGRQKNGNRNDILEFMSYLVSFARKNDCELVMPGTIQGEKDTAALTAVLVMKARVVGLACYGYGGTVLAKPGEKNWVQTLNGERKQIKSPVEKNERQLAILKEALAKAGYENTPAEVMAVFTSPKLELMNAGKANCFTRKQFAGKIREERYTKGDLDIAAIGKKLRELIVREDGR